MNAAGCSQARTLHCPTSLSFQRTKKNLSAGTSSQLHSSCCARLSHAPVSLSLGKAPKERKEAVTLLLAGLKKSTSALFSVSESSQNDSRALSLPVFVVVSGSFFSLLFLKVRENIEKSRPELLFSVKKKKVLFGSLTHGIQIRPRPFTVKNVT